jgi:hypothetical protein
MSTYKFYRFSETGLFFRLFKKIKRTFSLLRICSETDLRARTLQITSRWLIFNFPLFRSSHNVVITEVFATEPITAPSFILESVDRKYLAYEKVSIAKLLGLSKQNLSNVLIM